MTFIPPTFTPGVEVLTGSAASADMAGGETEQSHAPHFVFPVGDTVDCGAKKHFILSMTSDQAPPPPGSKYRRFTTRPSSSTPREPRKMWLLTRLSELNYSAVGTTPSPTQRTFSSVSRGVGPQRGDSALLIPRRKCTHVPAGSWAPTDRFVQTRCCSYAGRLAR
jgi:hypothetical protein